MCCCLFWRDARCGGDGVWTGITDCHSRCAHRLRNDGRRGNAEKSTASASGDGAWQYPLRRGIPAGNVSCPLSPRSCFHPRFQVSRLGILLPGRLPIPHGGQWPCPFVRFTVTGIVRNSHPLPSVPFAAPAHMRRKRDQYLDCSLETRKSQASSGATFLLGSSSGPGPRGAGSPSCCGRW